jgi:hypothetical protein
MNCCGPYPDTTDYDQAVKIAKDLIALDSQARVVYQVGAQYFIENADIAIETGIPFIQVFC